MKGSFFVPAKGAEISYVNEDGEITSTIHLTAGTYVAATFEKLRRPGETVVFGGLAVHHPVGNSVNIVHPGAYHSAANPSFRVSPAQRQAKELQRMMVRTEALAKFARKGMQAIARARSEVPKLEAPARELPKDAGEVSAT